MFGSRFTVRGSRFGVHAWLSSRRTPNPTPNPERSAERRTGTSNAEPNLNRN
jgi:hypothetical protein